MNVMSVVDNVSLLFVGSCETVKLYRVYIPRLQAEKTKHCCPGLQRPCNRDHFDLSILQTLQTYIIEVSWWTWGECNKALQQCLTKASWNQCLLVISDLWMVLNSILSGNYNLLKHHLHWVASLCPRCPSVSSQPGFETISSKQCNHVYIDVNYLTLYQNHNIPIISISSRLDELNVRKISEIHPLLKNKPPPWRPTMARIRTSGIWGW